MTVCRPLRCNGMHLSIFAFLRIPDSSVLQTSALCSMDVRTFGSNNMPAASFAGARRSAAVGSLSKSASCCWLKAIFAFRLSLAWLWQLLTDAFALAYANNRYGCIDGDGDAGIDARANGCAHSSLASWRRMPQASNVSSSATRGERPDHQRSCCLDVCVTRHFTGCLFGARHSRFVVALSWMAVPLGSSAISVHFRRHSLRDTRLAGFGSVTIAPPRHRRSRRCASPARCPRRR